MKLDPKRLWNMSRHIAFTSAVHECPEQLAQDLYQSAWVRYLQLKQEGHLWKDLEYAMLEERSRWLYQCKRGRGKNRWLKTKHQLRVWKGYTDLNPERILILKEEYNSLPVVRKSVLKNKGLRTG